MSSRRPLPPGTRIIYHFSHPADLDPDPILEDSHFPAALFAFLTQPVEARERWTSRAHGRFIPVRTTPTTARRWSIPMELAEQYEAVEGRITTDPARRMAARALRNWHATAALLMVQAWHRVDPDTSAQINQAFDDWLAGVQADATLEQLHRMGNHAGPDYRLSAGRPVARPRAHAHPDHCERAMHVDRVLDWLAAKPAAYVAEVEASIVHPAAMRHDPTPTDRSTTPAARRIGRWLHTFDPTTVEGLADALTVYEDGAEPPVAAWPTALQGAATP